MRSPVQIWGVRRLPPVADKGSRASGSGRQMRKPHRRRRKCREPQQESSIPLPEAASLSSVDPTGSADFLLLIPFELAKPVRIWGARGALPMADTATRASGRGQRGTKAFQSQGHSLGTATGERNLSRQRRPPYNIRPHSFGQAGTKKVAISKRN